MRSRCPWLRCLLGRSSGQVCEGYCTCTYLPRLDCRGFKVQLSVHGFKMPKIVVWVGKDISSHTIIQYSLFQAFIVCCILLSLIQESHMPRYLHAAIYLSSTWSHPHH